MKKRIKRISIGIAIGMASLFLIYVVYSACVIFFGFTTTDNNLKNYAERAYEVSGDSEWFPILDSLPLYEKKNSNIEKKAWAVHLKNNVTGDFL